MLPTLFKWPPGCSGAPGLSFGDSRVPETVFKTLRCVSVGAGANSWSVCSFAPKAQLPLTAMRLFVWPASARAGVARPAEGFNHALPTPFNPVCVYTRASFRLRYVDKHRELECEVVPV